MGSKKSKEFKERMRIKEQNKNRWKNKIKPEPSNVKFQPKEPDINKILRNASPATIKAFERSDAQLADEKRKEAYQKVVYKKLQEMQEQEDFSR